MTETKALSRTVYEKVVDPIAAMNELGTAIAKSQMFGCKTVESGKVIAWHCLSTQTDVMSIANTYHIIHGRLSMKYDAMLAAFRHLGGKHKVVTRTEKKASIKLTIDDETLTESLTWDEAEKEPFVRGTGGKLKEKYASPRGRRQMLWARVVSEAVRTLRPEVVHGLYTPEEVRDFEELATDEDERIVGTGEEDEIIDAEFTATEAAEEPPFDTSEPVNGKCDENDQMHIATLFNQIGANDETRLAVLQKRGVEKISDLTPEQAKEIITRLEASIESTAKEAANSESRLPENAGPVIHEDAPVDQVTIDMLRDKLSGRPDVSGQVIEFLQGKGKKLADLTMGQAKTLEVALSVNEMERFLGLSLEGKG